MGLQASNQANENKPSPAEIIEKIMEVHILKPEMKSPFDFVQVKNKEVLISVWRDLPPEPQKEKIECLGYQWLLTGRGQKMGEGASKVFELFPDLKQMTLQLVEADFTLETTDGGRGKMKKKVLSRPYLTMTVVRENLQKLLPNSQKLKNDLKNTTTCLEIGRKVITQITLNL